MPQFRLKKRGVCGDANGKAKYTSEWKTGTGAVGISREEGAIVGREKNGDLALLRILLPGERWDQVRYIPVIIQMNGQSKSGKEKKEKNSGDLNPSKEDSSRENDP